MLEQNENTGLSPRHICMVCGKSHILNPLWNGDGECDCGSTLIFTKKNSEVLKPNKLLLITGGTGSGKNWIVKNLEGLFKNIPSVTDRKMRVGEVAGIDYKFITTSEFKEVEELGLLVESVKFGENFYGVESQELLDKLYNEGTGGILIVEPGGLVQVLLWLSKHNKCLKGLEIDQVFLDISRAVRFNNILGELVASGCEYLEAQELALNRIIRNGDNIPDDYKKMDPKISEAINELKSCGFTVSRHELKNKDSMKKFVDSYKKDELDMMVDNLVETAQKFELSFDELLDKLTSKIAQMSEGNVHARFRI